MSSNTQLVVSYLDALAEGRDSLPRARELLSDDLDYHDPLMAVQSADELIAALDSLDPGGAPIDRIEIAENDSAVAVLTTFALPTGPVFFTQWFWVDAGKIAKSRVIYDPAPFLEFGNPDDANT